jgi:hypothetical protein
MLWLSYVSPTNFARGSGTKIEVSGTACFDKSRRLSLITSTQSVVYEKYAHEHGIDSAELNVGATMYEA